MNSFTSVIYTFKVSKHIIIGQSTNINVFSWLLFFFKLRERERVVYKIWVWRKNVPKVTYLIFRRGSTGEFFFFHGLIDFVLFFLHWLEEPGVLRVSVILLSSTRSKMAMVRPPATNPAQKLIFLTIYFRWGEGGPTSVLRSQQIIWLLSLSLSGVRRPEVTKYQHLLIPLCDLHSSLTVTFFYGKILLIQTRGVVILSPSSQWDIAWQ